MSIFGMYLEIGMEHIADFQGYDHILFLMSLVAFFQFKDWIKVLKLVTAFTLGHSITLALSVTETIHFSTDVIEFLIPATIILTALMNIIFRKAFPAKWYWVEYTLTAFFGLIHGMGFSVLLRSLMGAEESITIPLLAFNVGLEIGQVLIVLAIMTLGFIFTKLLKYPSKDWGLVLSGMSLGTASILLIERWIW